ncbi:MAG: hypothetical protein EBS79_02745 [Gammaproteobacteria bacterium]|nr:hypothetical protein [Gammaproteobacteria bacterium]
MCRQCGYLYEAEKGDSAVNIPPRTAVTEFPEVWKCPECGASSDCLEEIL